MGGNSCGHPTKTSHATPGFGPRGIRTAVPCCSQLAVITGPVPRQGPPLLAAPFNRPPALLWKGGGRPRSRRQVEHCGCPGRIVR